LLDSRTGRRLVLGLGCVQAGRICCAIVAASVSQTINTFTNGLVSLDSEQSSLEASRDGGINQACRQR
jgi:hypothetical protein